MSIADKITRLQTAKSNIATAITTKGGTVSSGNGFEDFANDIATIPSGTPMEFLENGVNFIDYDGTLIETWEINDVASKTELPNNPTHDRLTAQGWNWTLSEIQSHVANNPYSCIDVGQLYTTISGRCEYDITLNAITGLTINISGSGTKDWGDGTTNSETSHTYEDYGDYTIIDYSANNSFAKITEDAIREARGSSNKSSGVGATFYQKRNLKKISIPNNFYGTVDQRTFNDCRNLETFICSRNISFYSNVFAESGLQHISLAEGTTSIPDGFVYNNNVISYITIPSTVTAINNNAFNSCRKLMKYDFTALSSVPTLANTNGFLNISSYAKIYVKASLEAEWKTATNWSTYANYIVGV